MPITPTTHLPALLALFTLLACQTAAKHEAKQEAKQEGLSMSAQDEAAYREMLKLSGADPDAVMAATKQVEASRKWMSAKGGIIHYHIEGLFQDKVNVVGGGTWLGYADVTDRVAIELDWKLGESTLAGTPVIQNFKSAARNFRNPEPTCLPPILHGEYEHFELLGIKNGLAGALEMQVRTDYPVVDVAQMCTGARVKVPASSKARPEELVVPSPVLLTAGVPDSDNLSISKDHKSLIHKKAGWTWTFTPSVKP
jgi:hypothetical protein